MPSPAQTDRHSTAVDPSRGRSSAQARAGVASHAAPVVGMVRVDMDALALAIDTGGVAPPAAARRHPEAIYHPAEQNHRVSSHMGSSLHLERKETRPVALAARHMLPPRCAALDEVALCSAVAVSRVDRAPLGTLALRRTTHRSAGRRAHVFCSASRFHRLGASRRRSPPLTLPPLLAHAAHSPYVMPRNASHSMRLTRATWRAARFPPPARTGEFRRTALWRHTQHTRIKASKSVCRMCHCLSISIMYR